MHGVLVHDMLGKCNLNAISLGSAAPGPLHTCVSGDRQTTVDYIFADVEVTSMISRCRALPMEDLNTSDHLPLLAAVLYTPLREENACHVLPRVDWEQAAKTGMIDEYRQVVEKCLNRFIDNSYDCGGC